jgi:hypothetical protein
VQRTARVEHEIGRFRLEKEQAVAARVRRIRATVS